MNKKITSIISCIIIIIAGSGATIAHISDDEPEDISVSESFSETFTQTAPQTEIISENTTENITEIFSEDVQEIFTEEDNYVEYHFRNKKLLNQHFEKHGSEFADFGYADAEAYEKGASDVINNPDALFKTEAEDGDGVYYIEESNEFVILSTDGYIRTYFRPSGRIDYFNRQ